MTKKTLQNFATYISENVASRDSDIVIDSVIDVFNKENKRKLSKRQEQIFRQQAQEKIYNANAFKGL